MPLPPRPAPILMVVAALAGSLGLSGCGGGEPAPPSTGTTRAGPPATKPRATTASASASPTTQPPPTTSTLGAFPPVRSSSPSPVDAGSIRSAADLPAAFRCLPQVTPIELPGSGGAPPAVVCPSTLAAGDALYLWFVDTPDARYLALRAALARSRFVRGGPNWVAGGARAAAVAALGGDVYR